MAKSIQLRFAIWICWFMAAISSSVMVYAAEREKFGAGMASIPFVDVQYMLIIAGIGGVLRTLMKICDATTAPPKHLFTEIFKDGLGAIAAGGLAYLMSSWIDQLVVPVNYLLQAVIIFFSGFGGAPLVAQAYNDGFLTLIWNFFKRLFAALMTAIKTPPPDGT